MPLRHAALKVGMGSIRADAFQGMAVLAEDGEEYKDEDNVRLPDDGSDDVAQPEHSDTPSSADTRSREVNSVVGTTNQPSVFLVGAPRRQVLHYR